VSTADVLISLILLISIGIGFMRGFMREAVSVISWIASFWLAWKVGPSVEPYLGGVLAEPAVRPWIARFIVMLVVLLLGALAGMLLNYFVHRAGLSMVDRALGIMFGLVRGAVLVGLLVIGCQLLRLNQGPWWQQSKLLPYATTMGDWLRAMVNEKGEPWMSIKHAAGVK
jgi:membrane protein required for colicin V production